jgi:hypothetical protein
LHASFENQAYFESQASFESIANPTPARSDSPDLIDGGPDSRGYSPKGHFQQAGNAGFTGRYG